MSNVTVSPKGTIAIALVGKNGAGKGVISQECSKRFTEEIPILSSGDMLRKHVAEGTEIGRSVAANVNGGSHASDEIVNKMMIEEVKKQRGSVFILDGWPRNSEQAAVMKEILKKLGIPLVVIHLDVSDEEAYQRLTGRRVCSKCKKVYNTKEYTASHCKECGAPLIRRKDDDPEIVKARLKEFAEKTLPVIEYLKKQGDKVISIDSTNFEEAVTEVLKVLKGEY